MLERLSRREYLTTISASVVATATGCLHGEEIGEWRMYGYDAGNTGHAPDTVGPKEEVSEDWSDSMSFNPSSSVVGSIPTSGLGSEPAVVDGVVYVGSYGRKSLFAYDAETGDELWSFETKHRVSSSPAVMDGKVYFGDRGGLLYALNADTGEVVWEFGVGAEEATPTVYDDKVFVSPDTTYAIDAETGEEIWSSDYTGWAKGGPAVSEGEVYVGRGELRGLDAETGEQNWSLELDESSITGETVSDGVVYVGSMSGIFYAVDVDSQEVIWESEGFLTSPPNEATVDDERVYFFIDRGRGERGLSARDKQTGEEVWFHRAIGTRPTVADDVVYLVNTNFLALDAESGERLWGESTLGGYPPASTSPVVVDERIYICGATHNITAYSAEE